MADQLNNPEPDVALAFALTFAAGFATVLGGMIVFNKKLIYLANPLSLSLALSGSAGVMIFISFVEIFLHAVEKFHEGVLTDTMTEELANGYGWVLTTGFFGVGILIIYGVDWLVHSIAPEADEFDISHFGNNLTNQVESENQLHLEAQDADGYRNMQSDSVQVPREGSLKNSNMLTELQLQKTRYALNKMGVITAIAIGMHNIPEGIATYVGATEGTGVGVSLAIGIALHNMPEGVAVALPIYFATGKRWNGILWCLISALAEPFGGFLAWLALGNGMNPIAEGILFAIVCGMMICISFKELLPNAYRFAGHQTHYVTLALFGGMFIMVTSLTFFAF